MCVDLWIQAQVPAAKARVAVADLIDWSHWKFQFELELNDRFVGEDVPTRDSLLEFFYAYHAQHPVPCYDMCFLKVVTNLVRGTGQFGHAKVASMRVWSSHDQDIRALNFQLDQVNAHVQFNRELFNREGPKGWDDDPLSD